MNEHNACYAFRGVKSEKKGVNLKKKGCVFNGGGVFKSISTLVRGQSEISPESGGGVKSMFKHGYN